MNSIAARRDSDPTERRDEAGVVRSGEIAAERRGVKWTVASFSFCMVALVAATIVMSSYFTHVGGFGIYLWAMVALGGLVMMGVLSAILLPYLKEARRGRS